MKKRYITPVLETHRIDCTHHLTQTSEATNFQIDDDTPIDIGEGDGSDAAVKDWVWYDE